MPPILSLNSDAFADYATNCHKIMVIANPTIDMAVDTTLQVFNVCASLMRM